MKLSLDLTVLSSQEWIDHGLNNLDEFLQDHADCERKASSMAMSFIAKAPEKLEIIPVLIETAVEELEHFQDVYKIMEKRGIPLAKEMQQDHYVKELISHCRHTSAERFMDRLLIASVVECRGAERFKKVADNIQDEELQVFYKRLWTSEAKHGHIFVDMALKYYDKEEVYERLNYFNKVEGEIITKLPIRAALH